MAIALGVATLAYRGPGRAVVRAHLGDVAATMLVFALLGLVAAWAWPRRWAGWLATAPARATLTMALAITIELAQLSWLRRARLDGLVLGTTFDGYDLWAYAAGVGLAVAWHVATAPRPAPGG